MDWGDLTFYLASESDLPLTIAIVLSLGVGGQWLANRLRIPGVLLLLTAGILVGPVFHWVDPLEDFGDKVLFPVVSLAVGLLLYEGGLGLKLDRLREGRSVVVRLVTLGAFVTWIIGAFVVQLLFDVTNGAAALIGAILVVSGPTVVIPLLHLARPREPSASILRWEGIIIDPVGATLAIVVLDAFINEASPRDAAIQIGITLGAGAVAGVIVAALALTALRLHLVPDHLINPAMLAAAIVAFAVANLVAPEAGLMATTMLGLVLANQHQVPSHELTAFSEDVGYLILGTLFIVLGAMVDLDELIAVLPRALVVIAVLVFVARPFAVWLCTLGTKMARNDRLFLAWMAPRGIVAASVATVFAQQIIDEGKEPVPELVPVVFATVIVTVALYGLTAIPVALRTRVAKVEPTGIALVSNHRWAVDLADQLAANDIAVLMISSSNEIQREALMHGVLAYDRPMDSHDFDLTLDGVGIKRAVLMTDDENFASLAAHHLAEHLGRANLFQVKPDEDDDDFEMRGRPAFGDVTFGKLTSLARAGGFVVSPVEEAGADALHLFAIDEGGAPKILDGPGQPGQTVVAVSPTAQLAP